MLTVMMMVADTHLLGLGLGDCVGQGLLFLLHGSFGEEINKLLKVHVGFLDVVPHRRRRNFSAKERGIFILGPLHSYEFMPKRGGCYLCLWNRDTEKKKNRRLLFGIQLDSGPIERLHWSGWLHQSLPGCFFLGQPKTEKAQW